MSKLRFFGGTERASCGTTGPTGYVCAAGGCKLDAVLIDKPVMMQVRQERKTGGFKRRGIEIRGRQSDRREDRLLREPWAHGHAVPSLPFVSAVNKCGCFGRRPADLLPAPQPVEHGRGESFPRLDLESEKRSSFLNHHIDFTAGPIPPEAERRLTAMMVVRLHHLGNEAGRGLARERLPGSCTGPKAHPAGASSALRNFLWA